MRQIVTGANGGKGVIVVDRARINPGASTEAKARIEAFERPRAPRRPIVVI